MWLPDDERDRAIEWLRAIQDRQWREVWPEPIIVIDLYFPHSFHLPSESTYARTRSTKPITACKPERKKPIEQVDHKGKERVNNPPVGLVTPDTDQETTKKTYAYDPHLDPQLVWAGKQFSRQAVDNRTAESHSAD